MTTGAAYGWSDRLLHRVALGSRGIGRVLLEMEDARFARALQPIAPAAPVFLTSLARAGTTVLLEILAAEPAFAVHTYRQMPFVLTPLLWEQLSRRARRGPGPPQPRAHGDGLAITPDSPEAFEEVLWLHAAPLQYRDDRILPWSAAADDPANVAALDLLQRHMAKMIWLRQQQARPATRYLSKNNGNIARTRLLLAAFADARLLVPFRRPLDHAQSLLVQHRRFLEIHRSDRFARRYMAWIGHLEFGQVLRPVAFGAGADGTGGWLADAPGGPETLGFWLAYWTAAMGDLAALADHARVILVSHEALCKRPTALLKHLAGALGLADDAALQARAGLLRPARHHADPAPGSVPADLIARARAIHDRLLAHGLGTGRSATARG